MMLQVSTCRHGCSGFRSAALDIELRRQDEVWRMYREDWIDLFMEQGGVFGVKTSGEYKFRFRLVT